MTSNPTGPIVEGTGLEDNDGQLDNDVFGIDTTDNEISPNTPFTLTKIEQPSKPDEHQWRRSSDPQQPGI